MAVPKYHEYMLPILKAVKNKNEISMTEVKDLMSKEFNLTEQELKEMLPSGNQTVFNNRVGWARTYLKKAALLSSPKKGFIQITDRGKEVVDSGITELNAKYLKKFPEFVEFQTVNKKEEKETEVEESDATPIEILEASYNKVNDSLKKELLSTILDCSPEFFERLVVDLLINMGYGGSRKEAGQAFATTGDEGIDGIIKEDKLGLDLIYIQAKRWKTDSTVGRPEIQKFAGALQGKRAKKGIFIATSRFSSEAREFVKGIDSKIILIDGNELTELMIESNTGVSLEQKFEVKKIDTDFFNED